MSEADEMIDGGWYANRDYNEEKIENQRLQLDQQSKCIIKQKEKIKQQDQQLAELKAEVERLKKELPTYDYKEYVKIIEKINLDLQQQLKEKDEEITTQKMLVDYGKEEIKKLHKRINQIVERDKKCIESNIKQVCEKIREVATELPTKLIDDDGKEYRTYAIDDKELLRIEKGEDIENS